MARILVTGASGFIGSTLVHQLGQLSQEFNAGARPEVLALLRSTSSLEHLKGAQYGRVEGSVTDASALARALEGVDVVFHLAGVTAARTRDDYFKNNALGTRLLAEAAAQAKESGRAPLSKFIYVSSLAAGGPAESLNPKNESHPDRPVSFYGESKQAGELELLKFKDRFEISIVRPPVVYGPKDRGVFLFIQTVARNLMPLLGAKSPDGHKYYSTIHSEDLVRGLIALWAAPKGSIVSGDVFYLADDHYVTQRQLLETIAQALGKRPVSFTVPQFAIRAAANSMDWFGRLTGKATALNKDKVNELLPDYWICSNEKAKRAFGFEPRYDLATGMRQAVEWYRRNGWIS